MAKSLMKVGVVGAGVMGSGTAQNLAQTGHEVILVDISPDILTRAQDEIQKNVRFSAFFDKSKKNVDPEDVIGKIKFTTDISEMSGADFVIENATEIWDIKKGIYEQIDAICHDRCVFAPNTSAIPITKIAGLTGRQDRVLGIHFMNPVPMKPVVEVIRGYHTSEATINKATELLSAMGKEAIIVNDLPGFVSNRISHLFMNEAAFVLQDDVASAEQVDMIFKKCYNHKMGPLETADLIGLDTVVHTLNVLYESYHDSKFRCCPLLQKLVQAGHLGRKSGKGFYDYNTVGKVKENK